MYFLRFAYYQTFYFLVPIFILALIYRLKFYRYPVYAYSLGDFLQVHGFAKSSNYKKVLSFFRAAVLIFLIFLIARPQWVDSSSKVNVEGVDIVLTIDVSGSMQVFDDVKDRRNRIQVAKEEAIRFIEKRTDDPIGVVIFAKDALSRCPLTLDKNILKEVIGELELGYINPEGTSLGTGLSTAVNRLRKSKAKSKIIILLTDGEPTPEKIEPNLAIDMAKQYGIKIYTIGIGNEQGGFIQHPFFGLRRVDFKIDVALLKKIAQETGGMFFRANNPAQMRQIYNTIDSLEKTEYQTDIFHHYYEAFLTFVWILLLLFFLELFFRLYFWRGICN
jgi:Ca-activated chloride channel homolog